MNNMPVPNSGSPRPPMDPGFRGPRPMFMPVGPNQSSGPPPNNRPPFRPPFDNNFRLPLNQGMPPPFMGPNGPGNNMSIPPGPRPLGGFMRPPPMMQNNFMPMPMNPAQRPSLPKIDPSKEVWVETNSAEGKTYFYNAKTRQSVWKRPNGENIQIIMQSEAQSLAAAASVGSEMTGMKKEDNMGSNETNTDDPSSINTSHNPIEENGNVNTEAPGTSDNEEPAINQEPISEAGPDRSETPKRMESENESPTPQQQPMVTNEEPMPQAVLRMPLGVQNQMPLRPLIGQGPPPGMMPPPRGMPPMMMNMPMRMPGMIRGFVPPPMMGPAGMRPPMMNPLQNMTEWRENIAPDSGRVYYYNIRTMETQWTKPKELEEFDAAKARMLEEPKLNIVPMNTDHPANGDAPGQPDKSQIDKQAEEAALEKSRIEALQKQEELQKQKQEQQLREQQQQQRPVATKAVPGTPWCVVWTGDDKVFFYNPTTRLSMWDKPDELSDRPDVDRILADPPHKQRKREIEETVAPVTNTTTVTATIQQNQQNDEPALKKKKSDKVINIKLNEKEPEPVIKEKPQLPYEERVKHFKDMLLERQVSAFSTWDKELHKIVFDPRFSLVKGKERKQVYDDFIKTRAEEERKERKASILKSKEEYKTLLSEVNSSGKMGFSEFAAKFSKEDRFKKIEKMKDREALFNEFIQENKKRKLDEIKTKEEKIKTDFFELLEENKSHKHSKWSRAKEKLFDDARYMAVQSSYTREEYWNEYVASKNENSAEDADLERQKRAEQSLRARAEEVEREKAERSREIDTERQKHRLDEASQHFKALLADMVRNTDQSWSETKRQLKKDNRWDLASLLTRDEKERFFGLHIDGINKKKRSAFKQMLAETPEVKLNTRWKEAKKMKKLKEDPRFTKFSSSDRKREREFDEYIKERFIAAKGDLRDLLRECKLITHKTRSALKTSPDKMKEIVAFLENDKRYIDLECLEEEREEVINTFIEELYRRGPPPPPTATEPNHRGRR